MMTLTLPDHGQHFTGAPCPHCGVRPDVSCRHRAADPEWTLSPQEAAIKRPPPLNHMPRKLSHTRTRKEFRPAKAR